MRASNGSIIHADISGVSAPSGDTIAFTDSAGLHHIMPVANILRLHSLIEKDCEDKKIDFGVWASGKIGEQSLRLSAPERRRLPTSWLEKTEIAAFLNWASSELCVPVQREFLIAVQGITPRQTVRANAVYWRGEWHNLTLNKTSKRWGVPEGVQELVERWRKET